MRVRMSNSLLLSNHFFFCVFFLFIFETCIRNKHSVVSLNCIWNIYLKQKYKLTECMTWYSGYKAILTVSLHANQTPPNKWQRVNAHIKCNVVVTIIFHFIATVLFFRSECFLLFLMEHLPLGFIVSFIDFVQKILIFLYQPTWLETYMINQVLVYVSEHWNDGFEFQVIEIVKSPLVVLNYNNIVTTTTFVTVQKGIADIKKF